MFYDKLVYSLALYITLTIAAVNIDPNISGWYKIASVTDDSFLTGNNETNISTTEHEGRNVKTTFQIWSIIQQTNGTNYFIISGHGKFRHVPLLPEEKGLYGLYQRYHFEPVGRNLWIIYLNGTQMCLTNHGIGSPVSQSNGSCLNTTSQLWILHNVHSSYSEDFSGVYYIQSPVNGKYITANFNSTVRTVENHIRKDVSKKQQWRFTRHVEYGACYEIQLHQNRTQLIPTETVEDPDSIERLTLVFQIESVGQARWKIKQLNSDNCLGFVDRDHTNQAELLSSPCENSNKKQIWFLIKLSYPDNVNEGSRGCVALVGSANKNEL